MTIYTATASAAGSFVFTTRNATGQSVVPVSTPVVTWYTDAERTLNPQALAVTGTGHTYTASWAGAAAPVAAETRYLKIEIETSTGANTEDTDDEILFVGVSATPTVDRNYTSLAAVKADLGITETDRDVSLLGAIRAASREVDGHTGTSFAAVVETRLFSPSRCGSYVNVDRFTDPTGLVVGTGYDGTYNTAIAAADYVLWPYNAPAKGQAYYRIGVTAGGLYTDAQRPSVQVTAAWGWHYVPDDVEEATRLRAIHLFHRREAPHGVADYGDDGVAGRNVLRTDNDVVALLLPYTPLGLR